MKLSLDKIGSVTKNCNLPQEVEITRDIICQEGAVIAVEVLEDKKIYNQLELVTGRMSTLKKGDVIAVALGNRRALKGFVGKVPAILAVGDTINILNLGGVAGICTSENLKEVGHALKAKVIGAIVRSDGPNTPLNIKQFTLFSLKDKMESNVPLIIVSGTCMNVGKTSVACEIIKHASRVGYKIGAAKLAGVAAMKDTENMKDYGAKQVVSFVDAGFTSTVSNGQDSVGIAKGAIDYLSTFKPNFIVIEFGDGVYGEYGVMDSLKDKEIQKQVAAHIGCAHDPMGAAKIVEVCKEIGAPVDMISGPVTDNSVGMEFISRTLSIPAINALTSGEQLFEYLTTTCLEK